MILFSKISECCKSNPNLLSNPLNLPFLCQFNIWKVVHYHIQYMELACLWFILVTTSLIIHGNSFQNQHQFQVTNRMHYMPSHSAHFSSECTYIHPRGSIPIHRAACTQNWKCQFKKAYCKYTKLMDLDLSNPNH